MTKWIFFLDDERCPSMFGIGIYLVSRTFDEAVEQIKKYGLDNFEYMTLDHDLGLGKSGYDFIKWLVEYDMENHIIPDGFEVRSHSSNPIGRQNILSYYENYMRSRDA